MEVEKIEIKPELYRKLVFIQQLSDIYFDKLMSEYGLTNRREFFAGHEFIIQYSNDFIKCNIWTDCDDYSIQFIDLYRIDQSQNIGIDFWNLKESDSIKNLYTKSSSETEPLSKTFVEKYLKKKDEYEVLNKPLKEYYESKGAKLIEQNFLLHSELFKQHPELFTKEFQVKQLDSNKGVKVRVETNENKDLRLSTDLTIKEKIKKYFGI